MSPQAQQQLKHWPLAISCLAIDSDHMVIGSPDQCGDGLTQGGLCVSNRPEPIVVKIG
jgi:hypothetical protein